MKISDTLFGFLSRYGSILVLASTIIGVYLVMRNIELYRSAARLENTVQTQGQVMAMRRQQVEGVLRSFASLANSDPVVLQILQKHQIIRVQPNPAAPSAVPPAGTPSR